MQREVFTDAFVEINGVDQSAQVRQVTLNHEADGLEITGMGDDTHGNVAGLKNWSLEVEFYNDFTDGGLDQQLFNLVGAAPFLVKVRPRKADPIGLTNPEFSGNAILTQAPILSVSVGEVGTKSVTFQPNTALARATA